MTVFQLLVIARWVHFAAVFALFGSALFWFYAFPDAGLGPRRAPQAFAATGLLLRAAAAAAALSGLAWVAGTLVSVASGSPAPDWGSLRDLETLHAFFLETNFGHVWMLRLALLAAALYAALRRRGLASLRALVLLGALILVSQAWLGHAAQGGTGLYGAAMIVAYGLHVLAAGAWVGGLPPLLFAAAEAGRKGSAAAILQILFRFSAMAIVAVAVIVATGAANAGFRVGASFGKLFNAPYDDVLFVKLALVAAMLVLALFNRFVAMPGLRARRETSFPARTLCWSVGAELALGALVLAAAAVLGLTPPPQ